MLHFTNPSTSSTQQQVLCFIGVFKTAYLYIPRYINSDEKGIQRAARKTGAELRDIKWLGLSMMCNKNVLQFVTELNYKNNSLKHKTYTHDQ